MPPSETHSIVLGQCGVVYPWLFRKNRLAFPVSLIAALVLLPLQRPLFSSGNDCVSPQRSLSLLSLSLTRGCSVKPVKMSIADCYLERGDLQHRVYNLDTKNPLLTEVL